ALQGGYYISPSDLMQGSLLPLALILLVAFSCVAASIIARGYRRRMRQLVRAPRSEGSIASPTEASPIGGAAVSQSAPATVSLADNRAAGMRLTLLLVALSCLIAATSASIWWTLSFPGKQ